MIANLKIYLLIMTVALIVCPGLLVAKPMNSIQSATDFLAEKVVFCYSRDSLASYKSMVDVFDIDGMNSIVLTGKCDFVPDGKYLGVQDYNCHAIRSTKVISVAVQGVKLWTFVSLVSRGDPDYIQSFLDKSSNMNSTVTALGAILCSENVSSFIAP